MLLEATRARRLARDARAHERAARRDAAPARDPFAASPPTAAETPHGGTTTIASGWQRRPLADHGPISPATPRPAEPTHVLVPPRSHSGIPAQASPPAERLLAAELREARATLAIARETTQSQREEIARLRSELAARGHAATPGTGNSPPSIEPAVDEQAERSALRGRIVALEAELEQSLLERVALHQALAAQQRDVVDRNRNQTALQERIEQLERNLEEARRRAEEERRRNGEAQSLLSNLRSALRSAEPAAGSPHEPHEGTPHARALPIAVSAAIPSPSTTPEPQAERSSDAAAQPPSSTAATRPSAPPEAGPHPIFSFWLEDQVRRRFGPLGIDSIPDLLREPLARRARSTRRPLSILLAGRGVAAESRALAESLVRAGAPEFVLHVSDPKEPTPRFDAIDDPLCGRVRGRAFPATPEALRACLLELEPAVVVTQELLTWQNDVVPWLEALRSTSDRGSAIVLLEQAGLGPVKPDDAFAAIGERIWELLPERYTRVPATGQRIESFRDALTAGEKPPRNELLRRLREGFDLELLARFGFLAEAFVRGPIAGCFDPQQARDRRFVQQIADVDERRLEAGNASALYLVARVDSAGAH